MAHRGKWIAAGVAAFLVCLVAMVPAGVVAGRLPPGIAMGGLGGTIWSGRAATLIVNRRALGAVEWSCRPWRVVLLEWSCRLTLRPGTGAVTADLSGNLDGDLTARDISGQVPIASFEGLASPPGWTGQVEFDIERLRVAGSRPVEAAGRLLVRSLKAPGPRGEVLGDFELVIGQGAVGTESLTGRLRDLGGPLRVRGAIELKPDGSYLMSGETAPGPGAGPAIFDTLAFLGPPDDLGRRPFTIEGTL